jgi:hypothetical protein
VTKAATMSIGFAVEKRGQRCWLRASCSPPFASGAWRSFDVAAELLVEAGFEQPPQTWDERQAMLVALRARFDARQQFQRSPLYQPLHEPEPDAP